MAQPQDRPNHLASIAVFNPQSKAPQEGYLDELQSFFARHDYFDNFRQDIVDLADVWKMIAEQRDDIAALPQGLRHMRAMGDWIMNGKSGPVSNSMSGIITLPLLVIMQVGQYFQYLEVQGVKHSEFLESLRKGGGIQGYCGGLPPAIAIACSKDEEEVLRNAAIAMRIALAIGAYGELGDDESIPGATTLVVRTKQAGQGDQLISQFPGSYISAVTDPKTISIVGTVPVLAKLKTYAREQGCYVQDMFIRGKVHNPENADLAKELRELSDRVPSLQLPSAGTLQVPVRSNRTGQVLADGSLTHEVVDTILASRCEWFTLLNELAKDLDLGGRRSHTMATFGIGDCVPLAPFHKLKLHVTKLDVLSLARQHLTPAQGARPKAECTLPSDSIAIVGASCRLPGANNLDELWNLVSKGISKHEEVPPDRVDLYGSFRASQDWKFAGKRKFYGNFIDNVGNFDHAFFGTNPKEALNMDPQQRILLELAYQAMESSGYLRTHQRESGDPVGCFIGASFTEYLENTCSNAPTAYSATGTIRAFLSGKISYHFGWSGPSEVLDTACSSSLVAVHRASKAIQAGECTMALAGGVNIISGIHNYLDLGKAGFLSNTGQCKPFDESADGYCRADGGGLVVLKALDQAIKEHDQILGIIPAVATNQGGLSPGITIPSSPAQRKLYQTVLRRSGLTADQVTYVEAHGTGTQAGDPLEIASVREVFGGPQRSSRLDLGSLKGNIGHSETGAGVASLLKVLAMIHHRGIPPLASHKSLNPKIPDLAPDNMHIPKKAERWDAPLLAACVNSYGAAGSNCALLCCEAPPHSAVRDIDVNLGDKLVYPILLSAASKESLVANATALSQYLQRTVPRPSVRDLAFTLSERRKRDRFCFAITASDACQVAETLKPIVQDANACFEVPSASKSVVLVFGGQSKQNVGFQEEFYRSVPTIRKHIDECNDIVVKLGFSPILPAIFQSEPISDIVALQCGTFAMQYACAMCWFDAGLEVAAVVGHSFGELTAMVVSRVLSLHDGLKLIATRASLMMSKWGAERGNMLAVFSSRSAAEKLVRDVNADSAEPDLEVACFNSPSSQTLVGSASSVARAEDVAGKEGIRCQRVDVTHGFHSKFTTPILHDLDELSKSLTFRNPEIPFGSCTPVQIDQIRHTRPSEHARSPVYFEEAIRRVEERLGPAIWLEAGMGSSIASMVKAALVTPANHTFLPMKTQDAQPPAKVLSSITIDLWRQGHPMSHWSFIPSKELDFKQVWLPPYQFRPTPHWLTRVDRVIEAQKSIPEPIEVISQQPNEPLKLVTAKNLPTGEFYVHVATQRFQKIVSGHAVRQRPLCPASMYMESAVMALEMLHGGFTTNALHFGDLSFQAPLGVDLNREIILTLEETGDVRSWTFVVKSASKTDPKSRFQTHAKGSIALTARPKFQAYERLIQDAISEVERKPGTERLMAKRAYGLFAQVVSYGYFLKGISLISLSGRQAVGTIEVPVADLGAHESTAVNVCDTISLDTFIQVVGLLMNSSDMVTEDEVMIATGIESASLSSTIDFSRCRSWTVYATYMAVGDDRATGDVFVLTRDGTLVMSITGCQFNKLQISKLEKALDSANPKAAKVVAASENIAAEPMTASSKTVPAPGLEATPDLSSADSDSTDDGPQTPVTGIQAGVETLRNVLSEYTGVPAVEITEEASLGELGIDSLAAVELAEELSSRFGKDVASEDLLASSYRELIKICELSTSVAQVQTASIDSPAPSSVSSKAVAFDVSPTSTSRLNDLLKILSESSGAAIPSIDQAASLRELGIDSLSAVELKDDLENAFSLTIDDDTFSLDSTVQEVADFLGVSFSDPPTALAGTIPIVEKSKEAISKSCQVNDHAAAANPFPALAQFDATFDAAAAKRGYTEYWTRVAPSQNQLLLAYISEAFTALGTDLRKVSQGDVVPIPEYLPKHDKVFGRLLEVLAKHHIISKKDGQFIRQYNTVPIKPSGQLYKSFVEQFPEYGSEAELMALTGSQLAACLSGKKSAVSVMFKDPASMKIMEEYYCHSPMLSTMTEQLVTFLGAVVAKSEASASQPIRILEVGAGFGGTTTRLVEVLATCGRLIEYTFTDISPSLIKGVKSKFARYPWVKFQTLNLEQPAPAALNDRFDIILGTNCVHATTVASETLRRLRQLLNKDGFIVLSEVTQIVDWYDIVFGLLDGWWLAQDGTPYPLRPADVWMDSFKDAGFKACSYSQGSAHESNTQRLLVASQREFNLPPRALERQEYISSGIRENGHAVETVVYKEADGIEIPADIYLPKGVCGGAMPIALMIHGGGHMTLTRKAIRPAQTAFLLDHGILPVSLDYRLCPETNIIDGPMTDVRDAYAWARSPSGLQAVLDTRNIRLRVDTTNIVMIGWSTGGHLAMTTAWTTKELGLPPPKAVLAFYSPTDFTSGAKSKSADVSSLTLVEADLDGRRAEEYAERSIPMKQIIASLPRHPFLAKADKITSYDSPSGSTDRTNLGWVRPGDPRSELILSLFKENTGLPLLLNGLPSASEDPFRTPDPSRVTAISPIAHLRSGAYATPTFIIHGTTDEIVPFHTAQVFAQLMKEKGVRGGLLAVEKARHIHDLKLKPNTAGWKEQLEPGYEFLFRELGLKD
ncbi:MAG: hypothetical protein Q9188_002428 [Gyalolechia gomerana]